MQVFKRDIANYLHLWRNRKSRKPLVLRGARQVGKTTLIQDFSKGYRHSIHLNLEKTSDRFYFEEYSQVGDAVDALFLKHNIPARESDQTLLFIDEIQESPQAIQQLRYFYEEFPELNVIAAGSLLEFAMKKVRNFPVGRVEYLYMHPLNFSEFLNAVNQPAAWKQLNYVPLKPFAYKTLLDLYHRYAIIGGMPEIISNYLETNTISDLPVIYESIWQTYRDDVEKYAGNETERKVLKHIMSTAHLYLDQRIKFQNFGNSNYRSREVGEAMRTLEAAKIIRLIYPTMDIVPPLKPDLRKSPRLQFLDTGIVNYTMGIQAEMLALNDLSALYKGQFIPHLITQELISLNTITDKKPNFWIREKKQSSAEVDLVLTVGDKIIPIEIKSGKSGALKSLHQFMDRSPHPYAVRIYAGEYRVEKAKTPSGTPFLLMNLPYFLGTKIYVYIHFFLDNYKL